MPKWEEKIGEYIRIAKRIRRTILDMVYRTKSPHIGSSFSIVEVLIALYFKFLNISPSNPIDQERDRFILSKGHACPALYAVLAERGFITKDDLNSFATNGGVLEQHPSIDIKNGIEITTGSLGHGLSIGVGMVLAQRMDGKNYKVYVLLSDGELNEGSTWEAVMFAGHHKLSNLIAIVDCNGLQALGYTREIIDLNPVGKKWKDFNWHVQKVDGHDFEQIFKALSSLSPDRPNAIILHTIKGKGVSFMENKVLWHYRAPDDKEYELAMRELSE